MSRLKIARVACLGGSLLVALAAAGTGQQPSCPNPQTPRNLDPKVSGLYDKVTRSSIVNWAPPAQSVEYRARPECAPQKLLRCGQHYHFPVENTQGCQGEARSRNAARAAAEPQPGDLVEVHTVFASKVRASGCDPVTLDCCEKGPFLVLAYAAKVTAGGAAVPIVPPTGRPLAEWSGSTTNEDAVPGECKPPAEWSFRLRCDFTINQAQLRELKHPDPARPLQPCDRLSRDLAHVLA